MRRTRVGFICMLAALCLAPTCASNPRPIDFSAEPAEWEALVGRWRGTYDIPGGRHGVIEFTLAAGAAQAYGDVLMIASDARGPYLRDRPVASPDEKKVPGSDTQLLVIRFVRAAEGHLRGLMVPYWDPDRECQAAARFDGALKGSVIEGAFTSTCADDVRQLRGVWSVRRGPR